MGKDGHFEFKTFKQQIEDCIINEIKLWDEDVIYIKIKV